MAHGSWESTIDNQQSTMLLTEITINAVLNRISREGIALAHWWDNKVVAFDPPQYKTAYPYGGYCALGFGSLALDPALFDGDWDPPFSCPVTVKYTATDEGSAATLFSGNGHLMKFNETEVVYDLYGPSYSAVVTDSTAYNDTLVDVMTTLCGAGILNLTLDTTYARNPSPAVLHTTSGDQLAINLASDMCAFFNHLFYISGSTLYLVDMQIDNGSRTIDGFEFFPAAYEYPAPLRLAWAGSFVVTTGYPYGDELTVLPFHTTQANVETALGDILDTMAMLTAAIPVPLTGDLPAPGEKVELTDTRLQNDTDIAIRARTIRYDFDNEEVLITGEGGVL